MFWWQRERLGTATGWGRDHTVVQGIQDATDETISRML